MSVIPGKHSPAAGKPGPEDDEFYAGEGEEGEEGEDKKAAGSGPENKGEPEKAAEGAGEKLLAGKFKSAEDLERAYQELESDRGKKSSELQNAQAENEHYRRMILRTLEDGKSGGKGPTDEEIKAAEEEFAQKFAASPRKAVAELLESLPNSEVKELREHLHYLQIRTQVSDLMAVIPDEIEDENFRANLMKIFHDLPKSEQTKQGALEKVAFEIIGRKVKEREAKARERGRKEGAEGLERERGASPPADRAGEGKPAGKRKTPDEELVDGIVGADGARFSNWNLGG